MSRLPGRTDSMKKLGPRGRRGSVLKMEKGWLIFSFSYAD